MNSILFIVLRVFYVILDVLGYALVGRAILSWFVSPLNRFYQLLGRVTEPMVTPFRPLAQRLTKGRFPIDLAPLFAYLVLMGLRYLISVAMGFLR